MATTNFGALLDHQKKVWSRETWKTARQNSFIMQASGKGPNSPIQRITELTKSERGTQAVITLVSDLENDGAMGDSAIEGSEEAIKAYDQQIEIDQIRNANKSGGRITEQATIVKFRETSRDVLGFWLADRVDQLAFLTLSGVDYRHNTNGSLRAGFTHNGTVYARNTGTSPVGYSVYDLAFAADVTAPTSQRHFYWDATNGLTAADTTAITTADTPSYAMLVEMKAHAKQRRIRPVRSGNGTEVYHIYMHPKALAKLKLDSDFLANVRNAGVRGSSNPLFSGAIETVDGMVIHENIHVFNTLGATAGTVTNAGWPGYKWGANADVNGSRILLLGAQALAFCDLGAPMWDERDHFDYGNQPGIALGKIIGFLKPVFQSYQDASEQDFGVMCVDVAI